jgi:predicted short-subunit dehydrogenase-like oxidoreductase (DUF2520 family)
MMKVRIVGSGRAGRSFEAALSGAGVTVELIPGRSSRAALAGAGIGQDAVLIAVPDRYVAGVAALIETGSEPGSEVEPGSEAGGGAVLLHCSGSLGLEALGPVDRHPRRGSLHPLATLPDPVIGSLRLRGGTYFAVSGDQIATDLVLALGGQPIVVAPEQRARYHAAACVASNHIVALLGQVQRIAAGAGLPLEAFVPLARGALDDVTMLGPAAALTGPAARGDLPTLESHRSVIDPSELAGYDAGVLLASRLAGERAEGAATPTPPPPPPPPVASTTSAAGAHLWS